MSEGQEYTESIRLTIELDAEDTGRLRVIADLLGTDDLADAMSFLITRYAETGAEAIKAMNSEA
jgi:hypothetical protein